jgi:hypothetical protein
MHIETTYVCKNVETLYSYVVMHKTYFVNIYIYIYICVFVCVCVCIYIYAFTIDYRNSEVLW